MPKVPYKLFISKVTGGTAPSWCPDKNLIAGITKARIPTDQAQSIMGSAEATNFHIYDIEVDEPDLPVTPVPDSVSPASVAVNPLEDQTVVKVEDSVVPTTVSVSDSSSLGDLSTEPPKRQARKSVKPKEELI
jgi:hypothetical protein